MSDINFDLAWDDFINEYDEKEQVKIYFTRNSGHYTPFFLAPAKGFGSHSNSQWWPVATTKHKSKTS